MSEIQLLMQAHKEMEKRRMEDFTEMSEIQLLMQAHKEMEKRRMEELLQEERERGVYSSEIREESGRKGTVLQERDRFSRMRWFLRDDWEGTGRKEPVFQERARLPEMRQRGEASDKQVVDRESFIVKLQPVRDVYQNIISEMSGAPNLLSDFGKAVLDKISTGTLGTVFAHFRGTGFRELRRECWKRRVLFEDPDFPADDSSLYYKSKPTEKEIVWMRPKEIVGEALSPRFIVGNKSRFDVKQGSLGDCWLLAALANLTLHDELFFRVVPPDQSFSPKIYAGIFHFQFWRYGQWVDVVIDDRLPTVDGKLCYMRSETKNEFWSALLEKAYAKTSTIESLLKTKWCDLYILALMQCADKVNLNQLLDNISSQMAIGLECGQLPAEKFEKMAEQMQRLIQLSHLFASRDLNSVEYAYLKMISFTAQDMPSSVSSSETRGVNQLASQELFEYVSSSKSQSMHQMSNEHINVDDSTSEDNDTHVTSQQANTNLAAERFSRLLQLLPCLRWFDPNTVVEIFFSGLIGPMSIETIIPFVLQMNLMSFFENGVGGASSDSISSSSFSEIMSNQ